MSDTASTDPGTFLLLPRAVMQRTDLDWPAKIVWAEVYAFTRQGLSCWLTLAQLADRVNRSPRQVTGYLAQLRALNLVEVTSSNGRRREMAAHLPEGSCERLRWTDVTRQPASTIDADRQADKTPAATQTGDQPPTNKKQKQKHEKRTKDRPRDLDEVRAYFAEIGGTDPETFWDYWTSAGWRRKSGPIKDWQAAARTWIRQPFRQTGGGDRQGRQLDAGAALAWAGS